MSSGCVCVHQAVFPEAAGANGWAIAVPQKTLGCKDGRSRLDYLVAPPGASLVYVWLLLSLFVVLFL